MARLKIWDSANNTWQYVDSTVVPATIPSASYAVTASFALNGGGGSSTSASWASSSLTASAFNTTIMLSGSIVEYTQSYTILPSDDGKLLSFSGSTAANIVVSSSLLGPYFSTTIYQSGSGQLTFVSESNFIRNRSGHNKTAGQFAIASLIRINGREFVLTGDTTF